MSISSLRQDGGRKVTEDHIGDHPETQFLGLIFYSKIWICFCHPGIISQEMS